MRRILVLSSLVLLVATGGWAATYSVSPGESIQDAINAADPGDTINVAAGSYVGPLLIEKSLYLYGATAGVNKNGYTVPAGYAWDPAVETIITHPDPAGGYMTIVDIHDTGDVTFDGFVVGELNAVGNLNSSLLRVYAHSHAISNVKVENCVIGPNTNTTAQDGAQGRMGLYIVNHPYDVNGVENSSFSHNKIFDCQGNGDNVFLWTSYYAYGAAGPADMTGTVIDDNEIYGSHRAGIETAGGFANLTISNNTIYGNSQLPGDDPDFLKYGHGIQLIRGSSDKVSDPLTAYGPVDLLIIDNDIYGNSKCGVYMGPKNESVTLTNNDIHDNGWNGVMVDLVGNYWNPLFESPPTSEQYACYDCAEDISGSGNEIYGNGTSGNPIADYGVVVNGTPTNGFVFDASFNWWGDASGPADDGPGTGNGVSGSVDYSPWLGATSGTTPMTWSVDDVIGDAIAAAANGDIINVAAGLYPESLVLDKALSLIGTTAKSPATIVTGGLMIAPPSDITGVLIRDIDFQGVYPDSKYACIRLAGPGNVFDFTVDACVLDGLGGTDTKAIYGYNKIGGDWTLTGNEFVDCTSWYLFDNTSSGHDVNNKLDAVLIQGNHVHACGGAGAVRGVVGDPTDQVVVIDNVFEGYPAGSQAWACFEVSNTVSFVVYDNVFRDVPEVPWGGEGQGLQMWSATPWTVDIHDNDFIDNFQGIYVWTLLEDALWSGADTPLYIPGGAIYDNDFVGCADFACWVSDLPVGGPVMGGIGGPLNACGNWWGDTSGPLHATLNPTGQGGEIGDHILFDPWSGPGVITAMPAASGPINCGETVTLDFHYKPDAYTPELRGFTVTVECSAELSFGAVDIEDLNVLGTFGPDSFYVIDNLDGTFTIDSAILGGSTGLAAEADLLRIKFHPAGDGVGTVTLPDVELRDMVNGAITASAAGATITVDCTAPPGVTDLTSAPGHAKVTLDWTMADASDVDHYEVWRAVWNLGVGFELVSAYPEYDDDNPTEPIWPANRTAADASLEWVRITYTLPGSAVGYVDSGAPRGIYYYEVYAVDAADNIGPGAGPSNRNTNYWLGDVETPYDGSVGVDDIDELASTYGWGTGDGGYKNEVDVGPTNDNTGFGIPATDSEVDFEDLMIFALNYGNVAPRQPVGGSESPVLVWQRIDATTWALVLSEPCADLKGLHLRAPLPDGVTCDVFAGDLLAEQPGLGFAANAPGRGLDAGVALMGRGAVICGQGELVRVSFSRDILLSPQVRARDGSNGDLEISLSTEIAPITPLRFAAHPNFPNPFNPMTKIAFDLPEGRAVRVAVYAVDGSLVRMLIDGALPAGSHEIVWDGRDEHRQNVASGTYFYRIDAGTDSQVHKMMLMK